MDDGRTVVYDESTYTSRLAHTWDVHSRSIIVSLGERILIL